VVLTAEDRARVREFAGFLGLIRPGKGARRLLSHGPRQDAVRLLGWGRNTLTRKIKEHEEC
jgi:hypothetical protein